MVNSGYAPVCTFQADTGKQGVCFNGLGLGFNPNPNPRSWTSTSFTALRQWRIQGDGDTSPHRPQTPRPRKKFVCENSKFFRRFAPIIVQLIKNKYNNVTGKCQNCRELQLQYFLHAWGWNPTSLTASDEVFLWKWRHFRLLRTSSGLVTKITIKSQ